MDRWAGKWVSRWVWAGGQTDTQTNMPTNGHIDIITVGQQVPSVRLTDGQICKHTHACRHTNTHTQ